MSTIMRLTLATATLLVAACGGSATQDCNCGSDAGRALKVAVPDVTEPDAGPTLDGGQDTSNPVGKPDTGADTGRDTGVDTGTDIPDARTSQDAGTHTGNLDTGVDTGTDTGSVTVDAGQDASTCVPMGYRQACNSSCSTRPDGCGGFINCGVPPTCQQLDNICQQWNWTCGGTQQVVGCFGGGPHGTPCVVGDAGS